MKPELLSPAGNMEALKAAIHAGADAVYIGGKNYGARNFADNFTNEELIKAIKYAHTYDVKVYITANTIIYEREIDDFIDYLKFLYLNGVDAVIMQDIGMISLIRKIIPDLEIHASTQTNNCNDEVLKLYKDLGVKRVVLARELSLKQINNLKTQIDKEIFIHGALCICYSGSCLFSSLNGGRSGNRGKCAGPCRLPYTLIKNGKPVKTEGNYLLSPKELNTTKQINKILNSNVQSLKIEGRMKSPEYVYFVTKMYRELIDNKQTKMETRDLEKLFNRQFTEGHLFEKKNEDLMNPISPNHIGVEIGKVIKTNKRIMIKLTDDLAQNDGIRFKDSNKGLVVNKLYNSKGLLINEAKKGDIVFIDNKLNIKTNETVLKTTDYKLLESLRGYPKKKLTINFSVTMHLNKPLSITIYDNKNKINVKGSIVKSAITSPITKENIIKQLSKLGNTPFIINKIDIDMDNNVFISLKELNELRRILTEKLINKKTSIKRNLNKIKIKPAINKISRPLSINVSVNNEEQLKTVLGKVNNIYTDNYNLYLKYKTHNVYFKTDRTAYGFQDFKNEKLLLTELGSINKYPKNNICNSDYFLNVVNSYSVNFLENCNIKQITLSPELTIDQIKDILKVNNNVELIIYGKLELMVINHIISDNGNYLQNRQNELFPIIIKNNKTHIMHHHNINLIHYLNELKDLGLNSIRLELFDETKEQIISLLKNIQL